MVQPKDLSFDKGDRGWQAGRLAPAWLLLLLLEPRGAVLGSRDKPLYCGWHFRVKFQCGLGTSRLYLL